jgi:hypothetical protein
VRGCRAGAGTATFLQVAGERTKGVALSGNDLGSAAQPVSLAVDVPPDAIGM